MVESLEAEENSISFARNGRCCQHTLQQNCLEEDGFHLLTRERLGKQFRILVKDLSMARVFFSSSASSSLEWRKRGAREWFWTERTLVSIGRNSLFSGHCFKRCRVGSRSFRVFFSLLFFFRIYFGRFRFAIYTYSINQLPINNICRRKYKTTY